ncbi:MAG: twin transmembrane helix small protein [Sphingomonas sp.]|uniref:twin transmembrane helix small protein n=1 Tax=Sphingomonas sp. TaxID=28214 RepID=UPI003F811E0D
MTTFLALLLIAAMIATVVALVRGVVLFLKNAGDDVKNGEGPSATSIRSNQMMMYRIIFQAVAILIAVLLLLLVGHPH